MRLGDIPCRHLLANVHDHLTSWKVDLDVGGRNNTLVVSVSLLKSR